jgi:hypothetical protein
MAAPPEVKNDPHTGFKSVPRHAPAGCAQVLSVLGDGCRWQAISVQLILLIPVPQVIFYAAAAEGGRRRAPPGSRRLRRLPQKDWVGFGERRPMDSRVGGVA